MEKQLPDYFNRKLGDELTAFLAKDGEQIVSVAYLHIIEMPANSTVVHGFYGNVLSVFTEPEYRCKGLCTQLMKNLLEYGKKRCLDKIDLSATKEGYPVYKNSFLFYSIVFAAQLTLRIEMNARAVTFYPPYAYIDES